MGWTIVPRGRRVFAALCTAVQAPGMAVAQVRPTTPDANGGSPASQGRSRNMRRSRTARGLIVAAALTLALPAAVLGGQGIDVNSLNPVPPDDYTCIATGSGAKCTVSRTLEIPGPSDFWCGDAASPVQLVFVDAVDNLEVTRFYDANLNLVTRTIHEHYTSTLLNPETGLSVQNTQIADFTSTFTTPGDLSSEVISQRGVVRFFLPGAGVLLIDVGRELGTEETQLALSGRHELGVYYGGDTSILAALCEAVGSPGTPPLP